MVFYFAFYFKLCVKTLLWFVWFKGRVQSKWHGYWQSSTDLIVNSFTEGHFLLFYLWTLSVLGKKHCWCKCNCLALGAQQTKCHSAVMGLAAGYISKPSGQTNKFYSFYQYIMIWLPSQCFKSCLSVWTRALCSSLCELWWLCVVTPSTVLLTSQKCKIICLVSFTILLVLSHSWVSDDYYTCWVPPMHSWNIHVRVLMGPCFLATRLPKHVFICHQMHFTPV